MAPTAKGGMMNRFALGVVIGLIAPVLVAAALGPMACRGTVGRPSSRTLPQLVVREQVLCTIRPELVDENLHASPDSRRVCYKAGRPGKEYIVVDGVKGHVYDEVQPFELKHRETLWSPDSKRVAYWARRGSKYFMVVDGLEGEAHDRIEYWTFSPDSRRVAYVAWCGVRISRLGGAETPVSDGMSVVLDGKKGTAYDFVYHPVFSPDSRRLAYQALTDSGYRVVVDGVAGNPYETIEWHEFSPDSRRLAYVAGRAKAEFLVVDGVEGRAYERIGSFCFSPDSKRVAYEATRDSHDVLVLDGREVGQYDDDLAWGPTFSPDSRRVLYAPRLGGRHILIVDGVRGKEYDHVHDPVFSPNSKRVLYSAERGTKRVVVLDGEEVADHFGDVWGGVFSPDSMRVAYRVSYGKRFCVEACGVRGRWYDGTWDAVFSSDSKRAAYWAMKDYKWRIVVDTLETGEYDWPVRNGGLFFDGPDSLHGLALRGDKVVRIDVTVVKP